MSGKTGQKTTKTGSKTGQKTGPKSFSQRLCKCGCGQWFDPINGQQKYINKQHKQARFVNDKKDATYEAVWALVDQYYGTEAADKVAYRALEFGFAQTCKALERAGWKYLPAETRWMTGLERKEREQHKKHSQPHPRRTVAAR